MFRCKSPTRTTPTWTQEHTGEAHGGGRAGNCLPNPSTVVEMVVVMVVEVVVVVGAVVVVVVGAVVVVVVVVLVQGVRHGRS